MINNINYSFDDKKKINEKIEKLKKYGNKEDFIYIGKIILKSLKISDITEKPNGIWFDLNIIDNDNLQLIDIYITQILNEYINLSIESDKICTPYYIDITKINNIYGSKLTKKEKNLINKMKHLNVHNNNTNNNNNNNNNTNNNNNIIF
jgi:hypothetical protein